MRLFISASLVLSLPACAPAQIQLPTTLSEGSRSEFVGIGGRPSGQFSLGEYSGRFNRTLDRFTFDPVVERTGFSDFVIAGPEIGSTIEGRCDFREHALDFGAIEATLRPLAYRCDFSADGRAIPARFELREVVGGGSAIFRYERRGEIALGGEVIGFRSVHHLAGSRMPALTPVGYVFEQRGRALGALELTGRPALIVAPGVDPGAARTMTVAALALATFRDPAIHDHGD